MLSSRSHTAARNTARVSPIAPYDFQPLSSNEWRIVDSRHPEGSVDALVGFVARHNDAYYATRLRHPLESVPFASLAAVAAFIDRADEAEPDGGLSQMGV